MKTHSLFLLMVLLVEVPQALSQFNEAEYKKQADEIRGEVWHSAMPFFDQRTIPAGYEKYSKVILARREETRCQNKPKFKFDFILGRVNQNELSCTYLFRELVKINDAEALKDYSEINFQKFEQNIRNKYTAFLGFRIIKPDGSIKEVNPDEIILTDDKEVSKKAKLAVPGLQIGDIVDYFIESVEFYVGGNRRLYDEFVFAGTAPMLHYSIHIALNNQFTAEYRCMNGAPDFSILRNANSDVTLDAAQINVKQFPLNLWLSKYRQIPLIRIDMYTRVSGTNNNIIKVNNTGDNSPSNSILNSWKYVLENYRLIAKKSLNANRTKIKLLAESYLQNNGGGTVQSNSLGYYYAARHLFFLQPDKKDITYSDLIDNYSTPESRWFFSILQMLLDENKFDAQFILLPSKYGPRPGEAMYINDFKLALLTNDNHIYTAESVFDCPDQLPYYLEGQPPTSIYQVINFQDTGPNSSGYHLKISTAEKNVHSENLVITFNPAETGKIKVDRTAVYTGHTKLEFQKWLLMYEDYYEHERKTMGIAASFMEELNISRKGKQIQEEYQYAFAEARKQWKDYIKDEIKHQFDTNPEELLNCKIEQAGIFNNKPEFIYVTAFTVNDWIKTAGNNYIMEVGKIMTPRLKLSLEQRERSVDIYMPYARKFQYNVQIPIPGGFAVEGLDKLNSQVENTTGSFVTTATLDSGAVVIRVTQTFKNAFEKAAKWPELLGILDAATGFEAARILFKKL